MGTKRERYDSFDRGTRRSGGRRTSYAKDVSRNAAERENDKLRRLIIDLIFCIALPPYGIYRVWTGNGHEPPFKIAATLIAAVVMYLWFGLIIPDSKPDPVGVTKIRSEEVVLYSSAD